MTSFRQWDFNRHTQKWKAGVFVRLGDWERTIYAPTNFWKWQRQSRRKYILKRFPQASSICNGVPYALGGISEILHH